MDIREKCFLQFYCGLLVYDENVRCPTGTIGVCLNEYNNFNVWLSSTVRVILIPVKHAFTGNIDS
jgi:hypothetical protein